MRIRVSKNAQIVPSPPDCLCGGYDVCVDRDAVSSLVTKCMLTLVEYTLQHSVLRPPAWPKRNTHKELIVPVLHAAYQRTACHRGPSPSASKIIGSGCSDWARSLRELKFAISFRHEATVILTSGKFSIRNMKSSYSGPSSDRETSNDGGTAPKAEIELQ
eukprot:5753074-Pleurochrysis_carterae.AAC.4